MPIKKPKRADKDHAQAGFTLIEAMITLFVIAVGLLGIAALTAFGVGASHTAYMRSIASIHSENMAEMMRANMAGVTANTYVTIDYDNLAPDPDNCQGSSNCTATQLAQADAARWLNAVVRDLPVPGGGDPRVQVTCADGTTTCGTTNTPHVITVRWSEKGDIEGQTTPQVKAFTTVFRP